MFLVARFSDCELSCHGLGGHKLLLSASAGQKGVAIVANLRVRSRGGVVGKGPGEGAGKIKYKGKRQQPAIACTSPSEKKVSLGTTLLPLSCVGLRLQYETL